jgi:hypothetical protein
MFLSHRKEPMCQGTIFYSFETSIELDPSEADAQKQLCQLIARAVNVVCTGPLPA